VVGTLFPHAVDRRPQITPGIDAQVDTTTTTTTTIFMTITIVIIITITIASSGSNQEAMEETVTKRKIEPGQKYFSVSI
jgi:hypothetical protein